MQQILDELGELRGITIAVQALGAKLDAVLRQVGAPVERDPGDAVPPGVAVQSPAPLSAEDQAVLEKLENEAPETEDTKPRQVRLTAAGIAALSSAEASKRPFTSNLIADPLAGKRLFVLVSILS